MLTWRRVIDRHQPASCSRMSDREKSKILFTVACPRATARKRVAKSGNQLCPREAQPPAGCLPHGVARLPNIERRVCVAVAQ